MKQFCEAVMTVTEEKTAKAMGSGDLPVLATPAMIALMENAAMRCACLLYTSISQYAENVYFGKPSGLMDQTASSVGSAITIDFKDPERPVVEEVAFDLAKYGLSLCITDTKGSHANLTDDYVAIRAEMEQVAALFGKKVLREVDEEDFYASIPMVRELSLIHILFSCGFDLLSVRHRDDPPNPVSYTHLWCGKRRPRRPAGCRSNPRPQR